MNIKKIICFIVLTSICLSITGCTILSQVGNVTIDNISKVETNNKYTIIRGTTLIKTEKSKYKDFDEIEKLVKDWANDVSNRSYTNIKGDEDYHTYTQHYIDILNKERNDVEYTKKAYIANKLIFSLKDFSVDQVILGDGFGMASITVADRLDYAKSDKIAVQMGYLGGIGDFKSRVFNCVVKKENGKYLIYDIKQVSQQSSK